MSARIDEAAIGNAIEALVEKPAAEALGVAAGTATLLIGPAAPVVAPVVKKATQTLVQALITGYPPWDKTPKMLAAGEALEQLRSERAAIAKEVVRQLRQADVGVDAWRASVMVTQAMSQDEASAYQLRREVERLLSTSPPLERVAFLHWLTAVSYQEETRNGRELGDAAFEKAVLTAKQTGNRELEAHSWLGRAALRRKDYDDRGRPRDSSYAQEYLGNAEWIIDGRGGVANLFLLTEKLKWAILGLRENVFADVERQAEVALAGRSRILGIPGLKDDSFRGQLLEALARGTMVFDPSGADYAYTRLLQARGLTGATPVGAVLLDKTLARIRLFDRDERIRSLGAVELIEATRRSQELGIHHQHAQGKRLLVDLLANGQLPRRLLLKWCKCKERGFGAWLNGTSYVCSCGRSLALL